jgi:hypothetical protein
MNSTLSLLILVSCFPGNSTSKMKALWPSELHGLVTLSTLPLRYGLSYEVRVSTYQRCTTARNSAPIKTLTSATALGRFSALLLHSWFPWNTCLPSDVPYRLTCRLFYCVALNTDSYTMAVFQLLLFDCRLLNDDVSATEFMASGCSIPRLINWIVEYFTTLFQLHVFYTVELY